MNDNEHRPPIDWRFVAEYQEGLLDLVLAGEITIDEANAELAALVEREGEDP
jgi:hypothetical protein